MSSIYSLLVSESESYHALTFVVSVTRTYADWFHPAEVFTRSQLLQEDHYRGPIVLKSLAVSAGIVHHARALP